MSVLSFAGIQSPGETEKISSGQGKILGRTLEIGNTVINVRNIGTLLLVDGTKSPHWLVAGVIATLAGLAAFAASKILGGLIVLAGLGALYAHFTTAIDIYLLIGTCDGRRTSIVSKNKEFLRAFIRTVQDRIESGDGGTTVFNVSQASITSEGGGISFGNNTTVSGRQGAIG